MRLTILAGLITGAALGMQATLNAHAKPKPVPANRAIRVRVVAPWYIADNDAERIVASGSEATNLSSRPEIRQS